MFESISTPYATYHEGEQLVAVLGWNSPGKFLPYRKQLVAELAGKTSV